MVVPALTKKPSAVIASDIALNDIAVSVNNEHVLINESVGQATRVIERPKEGQKKQTAFLFFKRLFDIISSFLVSILLIVPIAVIAAVIVIKDHGNPFYIQTRVGKDGKPIKILKFRTMCMDADKLEKMLTPEQLEEYKREFKLDYDPRLIGFKEKGDEKKCFGARLRQLSIDELPQIPYNILIKGDMSVVGPRPILREELEMNYTPEQQKELLSVRPGLTGYWQAYARNNAGYDGERQKMELGYVEKMSPLFDLKIMLKTVSSVLSCNGAK
ncbi:MAG: sugar transferase [Oscillospiraceae bacterium]|nr:sugar transferase [Oscillospiraceae bacterium]